MLDENENKIKNKAEGEKNKCCRANLVNAIRERNIFVLIVKNNLWILQLKTEFSAINVKISPKSVLI